MTAFKTKPKFCSKQDFIIKIGFKEKINRTFPLS